MVDIRFDRNDTFSHIDFRKHTVKSATNSFYDIETEYIVGFTETKDNSMMRISRRKFAQWDYEPSEKQVANGLHKTYEGALAFIEYYKNGYSKTNPNIAENQRISRLEILTKGLDKIYAWKAKQNECETSQNQSELPLTK